jgi:NADPH-dependent 2,4-dienoyl-CoA reductase/sulfur reductase-like enzyme
MEGKRIAVVGAGPVGSLAALYAATQGASVEVYELRNGKLPLTGFFQSDQVSTYDPR